MADQEPLEVTENDILFTCYRCGKSHLIDKKAAGMMVSCTSCGARLRVPEKSQLLKDDEAGDVVTGVEPSDRIAELEGIIEDYEQDFKRLEESIDELQAEKHDLERMVREKSLAIERITEQLTVIQSALDRITGELNQL